MKFYKSLLVLILVSTQAFANSNIEGQWQFDHQICVDDQARSSDALDIALHSLLITQTEFIINTRITNPDCIIESSSSYNIDLENQTIVLSNTILTFTTCDGVELGSNAAGVDFDITQLSDGRVGLIFNNGPRAEWSFLTPCANENSEILVVFTKPQLM